MKTLIMLLTATVAVAGASQAVAADVQASDEAASNALSHGSGLSFGGAYDSAHPGEIRPSADTQVISVITSPAPPLARSA